jgi:hypothetical protein
MAKLTAKTETTTADLDDLLYIVADPAGASLGRKVKIKNVLRRVNDVENVKTYGAKGDAKIVTDGSMTGSSAVLTSATAGFTSADVGKKIDVQGVGVAAQLSAVIVGYTDSTHVTLSISASYTGSGKTISLDARTIATGSMTANGFTLTAGSAFFTAADVGKLVRVTDVGARNLTGTISGFTNSTTVTLSFSASCAHSSCTTIYGTDDHAAIAAAIAALPNGGEVYFPKGNYVNGSEVSISISNITFSGAGKNASVVYAVGPKHSDGASMFNSFQIEDNTHDIHLKNLGFSGTNWTAQFYNFVADCDGVNISTSGISNISATNCRFDSFWSIGFHNGGSVGATAADSTAVINISLTDCDAAFNTYDGLNPNPRSGLSVRGGKLHHNGTAGLETATSNATIDTFAYYNAQGGVSCGGYADPETGGNNTITGTYTLNGNYGIALGSNMRGCIISKAVCAFNGYAGIEMVSDGGSTLGGNNKVNGCTIYSNGSFGMQLSDDNNFVTNNKIFDAGISGYSQAIGMAVNGTGNKIWFNDVEGHASSDYNFSLSTTNDLIKLSSTATVFIDVGATVTHGTIDQPTISGTLKLQGANGTEAYSTDVSNNAQTILNNATWQPFGATNNFSGWLFLIDTSITGSGAMFYCGGGGTFLAFTSAPGNWSNTANTASSINVYNSSGITIQNKMGSTLIITVKSDRGRAAP